MKMNKLNELLQELGISKVRLANKNYVRQLTGILKKANLEIDGIIPNILAQRTLVLDKNEVNDNVMILDIGAGNTDIGIFNGQNYIYTNTIPLGGENITNDIALVFNITEEEAERLKKQYALALKSFIDNDTDIILNTYLDWNKLAVAVLSSISTVAGIDMRQPFLTFVSIISVLLSASELTDIKISENGTAIIMALQKHKKHRAYMNTEGLCKEEANEILSFHGLDEMDEDTFQNEITRLIKYKCIDNQNGMVKLKEKVISHY